MDGSRLLYSLFCEVTTSAGTCLLLWCLCLHFVLVKPNISPHPVLQLLEHECHRLAVEVPWWRSLRRVYVCVSVNPNETQVRTLLGMATHWSNSKAVKGKGQIYNYIWCLHQSNSGSWVYPHRGSGKMSLWTFPHNYLWSPPSMTRVCPAPTALLTAPDSILFAAPTVRGNFTSM